ncbi:protein BREVIS RADIX-like [Bidens hawaiensis]|uniref:protein BREVIS RADIX-like n=1 Tax=Bidens hawaiensis TaxID=980011 RepID=UPI00404A69B4
MQPGSSGIIPAWDFTSNDPNHASGSYEPPRQSGHLVLEDEDEPKEWMAQVEPGVQITFVSLPNGGNDLKRIRFNREMFNKWQAQRWWGENYDRIMELYNVQRFNCQALNTPAHSEDGRDSTYSRLGSSRESPMMTPSINKEWNKNYGGNQNYNVGPKGDMSSMEASRTTTSSRDEASMSVSNASDMESEWVEQDEPGVYITIRQLTDGTRELRRVRFSRDKFGEVHAKLWWEQNRERIQTQYL